MGLIKIGGTVVLGVTNAIINLAKFRRRTKGLATVADQYSEAAKRAGISTEDMLAISQDTKASTQFQRTFRQNTQRINAFRLVLSETRKSLKFLGFGAKSAGKKLRVGAKSAMVMKKELGKVNTQAKAVGSSFNELFAVFAGGLAALGAGKFFSDIKQGFSQVIGLAAKAESDRVSFNALIGDVDKSEDLLNRINKFSAGTPFLRSDIVAGSKLLLNISKDNVAENEKLFTLSANLAALRPGELKVADTSRAIFSAATGDFGSIKSQLGIVLRAEDFKKFGKPGGEAYSKAVIKAIQTEFKARTGDRDLIGELSKTFFGKVSTLQDNAEQLGELIGKQFLENFGIKEGLDVSIGAINDLAFALKVLFGELSVAEDDVRKRFLGLSPVILDVARFMRNSFGQLKAIAIKVFNDVVLPTWEALRDMSSEVRMGLLKMGMGFITLSTGGGVVGTIFVALSALFAGLATAAAPIAGAIIPSMVLVFGLLTSGLQALSLPLALTTGFFLTFRKRGESVKDTFFRLAKTITGIVVKGFKLLKALLGPLMLVIFKQGSKNIATLLELFQKLRDPLARFFNVLSRGFEDVDVLKEAADAGQRLADTLAPLFSFISQKGSKVLRGMLAVVTFLRSEIIPLASDVFNVGKAFFNLVTFGKGAMDSLKTIALGIADILTLPFRTAFMEMTLFMERAMKNIADKVEPFSKRIAENIRGAADFSELRETAREGFLATDKKFLIDNQINVDVAVTNKFDDDEVGDALKKTEMRARNSGRGGDPLNVGEQGFVINGSGTSIKSVPLDSLVGEVL